MQTNPNTDAIGKIVLEGLQGINNALAVINNRLEMLLRLDLPDYVKSDIANMAEVEQQASRILRNLNLICHKRL